jgi:hypothetical protein
VDQKRSFDPQRGAGRADAAASAALSAGATTLRAMLIVALLSAAPTPGPSSAHSAVAQDPAAAAERLRPALHLAPPLLEAPRGQRLRIEQDCGRCHRIEDPRPAPALRGTAVMT